MALALKRTFDIEHINTIINHDDIRHGARLQGWTDFSHVVRNVENVFLFNDVGGLFFIKKEPFIYEVHTQFLKKARGPHVYYRTREAVGYMFRFTPCRVIITQVYDDNPAALKLSKAVGMKEYKKTYNYKLLRLLAEDWTD